MFAAEDERIVQIDERRVVVQLDFRKGEGKAAPPQHRCGEPLASKRRELFDDARDWAIGEVQAAVNLGIVVTPFALKDARKP